MDALVAETFRRGAGPGLEVVVDTVLGMVADTVDALSLEFVDNEDVHRVLTQLSSAANAR